MDELLKSTLAKWTFNFAIICFFAIIGATISFLTIKKLAKRAPKSKQLSLKQDVNGYTEQAKKLYKTQGDAHELKQKTTAFLSSLTFLIENISNEYFPSDTTRYSFFKDSKYIPNGINLPLEFNLYELLEFLDEILIEIRNNIENILSSKEFRLTYKAYRLTNGKIEKRPEDLSISVVMELFSAKEEPPQQKGIKRILSTFVIAPVNELGKKITKPILFGIVDKFAFSAIDDAAESINKLYCGEYYRLNFGDCKND